MRTKESMVVRLEVVRSIMIGLEKDMDSRIKDPDLYAHMNEQKELLESGLELWGCYETLQRVKESKMELIGRLQLSLSELELKHEDTVNKLKGMEAVVKMLGIVDNDKALYEGMQIDVGDTRELLSLLRKYGKELGNPIKVLTREGKLYFADGESVRRYMESQKVKKGVEEPRRVEGEKLEQVKGEPESGDFLDDLLKDFSWVKLIRIHEGETIMMCDEMEAGKETVIYIELSDLGLDALHNLEAVVAGLMKNTGDREKYSELDVVYLLVRKEIAKRMDADEQVKEEQVAGDYDFVKWAYLHLEKLILEVTDGVNEYSRMEFSLDAMDTAELHLVWRRICVLRDTNSGSERSRYDALANEINRLIIRKQADTIVQNTIEAPVGPDLNKYITNQIVGSVELGKTDRFKEANPREFADMSYAQLADGDTIVVTFPIAGQPDQSYRLILGLCDAERINRLMSRVQVLRMNVSRKSEADRYDNIINHLNNVMTAKWNQENPDIRKQAEQENKIEDRVGDVLGFKDLNIEEVTRSGGEIRSVVINGIRLVNTSVGKAREMRLQNINDELQKKLDAANVMIEKLNITIEKLGKMPYSVPAVGSVVGLGGVIINSVQRELDGKILRIEVNGQMMVPAVKSELNRNASLTDAKEDANNIETLMNTIETLNKRIETYARNYEDIKKKNADYVAANLRLETMLKEKPMVGWSRDLDECRATVKEMDNVIGENMREVHKLNVELEDSKIENVSLQNQLKKMRDRAHHAQERVRELEDLMAKWQPTESIAGMVGTESGKNVDASLLLDPELGKKLDKDRTLNPSGSMPVFKSSLEKLKFTEPFKIVNEQQDKLDECQANLNGMTAHAQFLEQDMIKLEKENEVLWSYYEMRETEHYDDQEYHKIDGAIKRLVFERIHKLENRLKNE